MNAPRLRAGLRDLPVYPCAEGRSAFLRLDFNEGPPPPAEEVARALALCAGAAGAYPDYGALRRAASRAWGLPTASILPTNGADEGISLALRAFTGPGAALLLPVPTFPMYRIYAGQSETPVIPVPLAPDWTVDLEATRAALADPSVAMLALVSPNNPTGRALDRAVLEALLEAAGDRPVILDEAYGPFAGQDFAHMLARWPNLLLLRTLSKAHGMPGLRCGFLLADPEVAGALEALRAPFNVNGVAAALGAWLLAEDAGHRGRVARAVEARRTVQEALAGAGIPTVPSDAHFLMADLGPRAPEALAFLRARAILVKDLAGVRPGFVRASFALPSDASAFLEAFLPWWSGVQP